MDDTLRTESTELAIEGMSCDRCVARVEAALKEIPGVESVDAAIGHARVVYQPELASRTEIGRRIEGLGYRIAGGEAPRKGRIARWLDRMAKANAANFGTGQLSCCTVGRKKPPADAAVS
jgi:copper chaperone CopZ